MVEILLFSVGSGAVVTWLLFSFIKRKERRLRTVKSLRTLGIVGIVLFLMAACTGSKHAGQYLVSVRSGKDTIIYVDTRLQVDSIVTSALDGDLMGKKKPYFEIKNSEVFIYVQKKK